MNTRGEHVSVLASYLPDIVLNHLLSDPQGNQLPAGEAFIGTVLIADLSGFTKLTEQLSQRGVAGAEELTCVLNDYFGRVVDRIDADGGDIVRFAGDALLAVWPASGATGIAQSVRTAARCALTLQNILHGYQTDVGTQLAIKIGIGSGDFMAMHLGGEFDRREFLVTGLAFIQSFAALDQAAAGQVVVSLQAWSDLQADFHGEPLQMGSVLLHAGCDAATPLSAIADTPSTEMNGKSSDWKHRLPEPVVRSYVPATVCARLAAGQENWLGELRMVSVLFVNLPEMNYAMPLDRAQTVMQYLQQELYRYEGSINKLNVDDKGTSLLAAMGLPPLSHEDDAKRAVYAAMSMRQRLLELGLRSSTGIASGRVFCGSIGNARRREYTIMGDTVNLAARLMQTALGDIHCDETTFHMAEPYAEFQRLADINIKGKARRVPVFRPLQPKGAVRVARTHLVGREQERATLRQSLDQLRTANEATQCPVLLIEGPPGIGKSCLVDDMLEQATALGISSFLGSGDSIETTTLYYAWRPILQQLLKLDSTELTARERPRHVIARLAEDPALLRLAPLLSAVLAIDLPDNEHTQHMTGKVRGENTRWLLHQLLRKAAEQRQTVIVLDDAHWLDSASWSLLAELLRDTAPLLIALVSRPFDEQVPKVYAEILASPHATILRLDRLTRDDTERLLCHRVGSDTIPAALVERVYHKSSGNPLFCQQLANVVSDAIESNSITRAALLAGDIQALSQIALPETLHGAITSRIDRLEPSSQLALKVASVIGRHFTFRLLQDNFPLAENRPHVRDYLAAGLQSRLIEVEAPEPAVTYLFEHVFTREVAYELLLFDQRRRLHQSVAEWFERNNSEALPTGPAVLAHHWWQAGRLERAMNYLDAAGATALRNGAYAEAIEFIQDALQLADAIEGPVETARRARWERQLGEALLGLGKLAESKSHLVRALELLDCAPPSKQMQLILNLVGQLFTQLRRRTFGVKQRGAGPVSEDLSAREQRMLEAARAYERLAETYYLANNREHLVQALLATLNLAELAGPTPELARAYANNCFAAGLAGLHPLARSYARDAQRVAEAVKDPSATAWVHEAMGIYQLGIGEFDAAQTNFSEAIEAYRAIGDWTHWGETVAAAAQAHYYRGSVTQGESAWRELLVAAESRGDFLQQAWALNGLAEAELLWGRPGHADQAMKLLQDAIALYASNVDRVSLLGSQGLLAIAQLRRGDHIAVRESAAAGLRLIEELGAPTGYYSLNGYAPIAAVYLSLYEEGGKRDHSLAALARKACRALGRYARTFSIGLPSAGLHRGTLAWLAGREHAACRTWRRALTQAERLGMSHTQGRLHYEIGRRLANRSNQRGAALNHLDQACNYFTAQEANFDLTAALQIRAAILAKPIH